MAESITLGIQVCYAKPDAQLLIELAVPTGATVEQAIRQSGILERAPEIDLTRNKVGVFGKIRPLDAPVYNGDRVEIYRPAVDAKEARRLRAGKSKKG